MDEPILLPIRRNSISKNDKAKLNKAGIIVIEHENPEEIRLIRPSYEVQGSDLLFAAMKALTSVKSDLASKQREEFANIICNLLAKKQENQS